MSKDDPKTASEWDRVGVKKGYWTVCQKANADKQGRRRVWVKCICGHKRYMRLTLLMRGNSYSCGCRDYQEDLKNGDLQERQW